MRDSLTYDYEGKKIIRQAVPTYFRLSNAIDKIVYRKQNKFMLIVTQGTWLLLSITTKLSFFFFFREHLTWG